MSVRVREDRAGLVTLGCTACGMGLLVPLEDAADLRLWHLGDGSHRVITLDGTALDVAPLATMRAYVLALAIRAQDLADDLADLAHRMDR